MYIDQLSVWSCTLCLPWCLIFSLIPKGVHVVKCCVFLFYAAVDSLGRVTQKNYHWVLSIQDWTNTWTVFLDLASAVTGHGTWPLTSIPENFLFLSYLTDTKVQPYLMLNVELFFEHSFFYTQYIVFHCYETAPLSPNNWDSWVSCSENLSILASLLLGLWRSRVYRTYHSFSIHLLVILGGKGQGGNCSIMAWERE